MPAVNERCDPGQKIFAQFAIARCHPCLDERVTLPIAALFEKVFFHRRPVENQRPALAVRPQTHIDPEYEAVHVDLVERRDHFSAHSDEEFLIAELLPGSRPHHAWFVVQEHQIDVRRQVQFTSAQLAQRDDGHLLRLARNIADWRAELPAMRLIVMSEGRLEACVGKVRQVPCRLLQFGAPGQIAKDDSPHLPAAYPAKIRVERLIGDPGGQSGVVILRVDPLQVAARNQLVQRR